MEVPRLGVESELQLPTYAAVTAMPDLSQICNLHHSSWQHCILDPLRKARDRTCVLMDTTQVLYHQATTGTPNQFSDYALRSPLKTSTRWGKAPKQVGEGPSLAPSRAALISSVDISGGLQACVFISLRFNN